MGRVPKRRSGQRQLERFTLLMFILVSLSFMFHADGFSQLTGKPIPCIHGNEAENFLSGIPQNSLIIEPYHGLGNRLRAYGSAAALARKTGRVLYVIWIPDIHVNATMQDLFDTTSITVVDYPVAPALSCVFSEFLLYDYHSKGGKDEVLQDSTSLPIYVRSAYVLQSATSVSEADISFELLLLTPSIEVIEQVQILEQTIPQLKADFLGVHVRMNTDITKDVPGIANLGIHSPAGAAHMGPVKSERGRCHYKYFISHMEKALELNPNASFFVASDSSCAILKLFTAFPGKVYSTDLRKLAACEGINSRSKICLQVSLSEFLVLGSRVSYLILSEWSSASELILRLGAHKVPHESGCTPKRHPRSFIFFG